MRKTFLFIFILIVSLFLGTKPFFSYWGITIFETSKTKNGLVTVGKDWNDFYDLSFYQFENGALDVFAGYNHTYFIGNDYKLYSFGNNLNGKLGVGDEINRYYPTLVEELKTKRVVKVDSKYQNVLALTDQKEVYSFGKGTSGALGNGLSINSLIPVKIQNINNAIDIATGDEISAILTTEGIYVSGKNQSGAMGDSNLNLNYYHFTKLSFFDDKDIVSIYATMKSFFALTSDGNLYTWGGNRNGELGNGTFSDSHYPSLVTIPNEKIISVSTGLNHVIILTDQNYLYGFGQNLDYQLGNNTENNANRPTLVYQNFRTTNDRNKKITKIGSASNSNYIILENGSVYGFGDNAFGTLGFDRSKVLVKIPTYNATLTSKKVKKLVGGFGHGLLLSKDNNFYGFGNNTNGELGMGQGVTTVYGQVYQISNSRVILKEVIKMMPGWDIKDTINVLYPLTTLYSDSTLTVLFLIEKMPSYNLAVYGS
ncbi:hypothetical protein LJC17_04405 [Acholeplasma sp. OttesenSCG-928-E16]|nr:hypothetical protein [Acholeplasma sp. OttesenSCG-928-E16]